MSYFFLNVFIAATRPILLLTAWMISPAWLLAMDLIILNYVVGFLLRFLGGLNCQTIFKVSDKLFESVFKGLSRYFLKNFWVLFSLNTIFESVGFLLNSSIFGTRAVCTYGWYILVTFYLTLLQAGDLEFGVLDLIGIFILRFILELFGDCVLVLSLIPTIGQLSISYYFLLW